MLWQLLPQRMRKKTNYFRVTKMNGNSRSPNTIETMFGAQHCQREEISSLVAEGHRKKWFSPECMCARNYCKLLLSLYSFTIWFQNIIYSEKNKQCGCCFGSFCIYFFRCCWDYINSRSSRDKNSCRTVTALRCSAIFFCLEFRSPAVEKTRKTKGVFFVLVRPNTKMCLRAV